MMRVVGRAGTLTVVSLAMWGCAPQRFTDGVRYYADRYRVVDASVRRVRGEYWHLRFDAMLISDLDDALGLGSQGDAVGMRRSVTKVLREADLLARRVFDGEIERMPQVGRSRLAALAGCGDAIGALKLAYRARADAAITELVERLGAVPDWRLRWELAGIRGRVESAPDDQGRLMRQVALAWAALPAWIGLEAEEAKTEEKTRAKVAKPFEAVALWRPSGESGGGGGVGRRTRSDRAQHHWQQAASGTRRTRSDLAQRYAPTIAVRWPAERSYPEDFDRVGSAVLSRTTERMEVAIDVSRPVVYSYLSQTKIQGRRHQQIVYVWWFPERPEMAPGDPSAGHIDGNTLRVTLDAQGRPSVFEVMLNCGCGHQVFVDRRVEEDACRAFGGPDTGKPYCVARRGAGRYDVVVAGTVEVPRGGTHAIIYVDAGYHEVCRIGWLPEGQTLDEPVVETSTYDLLDYSELDRLPLGDGVASMFGSDGLVPYAGRPEGYLLAPTGIMSAGQPRKRGTQKIRWDAFTFDDPHLLDRTLRLADGF